MRELVRSLILVAVLASAICASAAVEVSPPLALTEKHPVIARNVTKLIEEMHYSRPQLDNSLSSAVLDGYLDTLDGNRMYFLASDVASFGRYRYEFDERTRSGALEPVFDIFNLFRVRTTERINYAIDLLATEPDFTVDEEFQVRSQRARLAGFRRRNEGDLARKGEE